MNRVSRGVVVLVLLGLVIGMTTGSVFSQDAPPIGPSQLSPQVAREVVSSWSDVHPLEFYLALPVIEYVAQAQTPSLANVHPLEYYLAFPIEEQLAQEPTEMMSDVAMEPGR